MLEQLKERVHSMDVDISFTEGAVKAIAKAGFDDVYGARPLRRAIQSRIEDPLSEALLEKSVKAGDKVFCDYNEETEKFVFRPAGQ